MEALNGQNCLAYLRCHFKGLQRCKVCMSLMGVAPLNGLVACVADVCGVAQADTLCLQTSSHCPPCGRLPRTTAKPYQCGRAYLTKSVQGLRLVLGMPCSCDLASLLVASSASVQTTGGHNLVDSSLT